MKFSTLIPIALLSLSLTGCAGMSMNDGRPDPSLPIDQRVQALQQQNAERPQDISVATSLELERQQYVYGELMHADMATEAGQLEQAAEHLNAVLAVDPTSLKARQNLQRLGRRRQAAADVLQARKISQKQPLQALDILSRVLLEQPNHTQARALRDELLRASTAGRPMYPRLSEALAKPVSLNFKTQPLSSILAVISKVSGVNFVFDQDVDAHQPATVFAEKVSADHAIDLVLQANRLEKKVLDANTMLLYPATAEKKRAYQEYAIRTFFLSHADAKAVVTALRQLVKPKDVYVDDRVNAVVVRDKPEALMVAERVVMSLDIPQSEVTLDVQVLEVNMNDNINLGLQYPGKLQVNAIPGAASGVLTVGELLSLNRDRMSVGSDSGALGLAIDMLQKQGKTKTLANPKIRVRNMEKASIKIGERVPIVTTTNANGVVSESVSYQDVGLLLQVEPRISLNDEVSVKVNMEVSNILSKQTTKSGLVAYSLGTRNAQTLMTARNSETQVLAGLIKRDESASTAGLPGLSTVPGVGGLFGTNGQNEERTEIVLLITPHIERNLDLPLSAVTTFLAGTEMQFSSEGMEAGMTSAQMAAYGPDMNARIVPPRSVEPLHAAAPAAPALVAIGSGGAYRPVDLDAQDRRAGHDAGREPVSHGGTSGQWGNQGSGHADAAAAARRAEVAREHAAREQAAAASRAAAQEAARRDNGHGQGSHGHADTGRTDIVDGDADSRSARESGARQSAHAIPANSGAHAPNRVPPPRSKPTAARPVMLAANTSSGSPWSVRFGGLGSDNARNFKNFDVPPPGMPKPVRSQSVAPQPKITQPVAPQPKAAELVTLQTKMAQPVVPQPKTAQAATAQPKVTQPAAPQPKAAEPASLVPETPQATALPSPTSSSAPSQITAKPASAHQSMPAPHARPQASWLARLGQDVAPAFAWLTPVLAMLWGQK